VARITLDELARRFELELVGDGALGVERVATLSGAAAGALTFLANPRYKKQLAETKATAVVLTRADLGACRTAALVAADPYLSYARIAALLHPAPHMAHGIDPTASVAAYAKVAPDAAVGARAVIGAGAVIGPRASIGPGAVVGEGCTIGADSRLEANVTLYAGVVLGRRCLIHSGAVLGADGFGMARAPEGWVKVPQVGGVRLGDDVEVGANTTIDRGAIDDTVIEDGVKLDNLIQVGHNVVIGAHTAIAGTTAIAGSTTLGKRCMIAGGVGIAGHLNIVDDVVVTARTFVTHSIDAAGVYSGSLGFDTQRRWQRRVARFRRLDGSKAGDKDTDGGDTDG
jgi:UDP-3-O-[3-hydroxymyristoyl] glucosamine N-acyltransferase